MLKRVAVESAAEAYLEFLAARGIEYFFGNAGTDFAPIVEAYAKRLSQGLVPPRPMTVPHEVTAVDADSRSLDALADRAPFGTREVKAEVVEAAVPRVDGRPRGDEVEQVVAAWCLKEDHAPVRERDLEAEDVDVEPLRGRQVTALERDVA